MRSAQSALCFYTAEEWRAITPLTIVTDDQFTTDTAPLERWDCDVLEEVGAARLKALVGEICTQLDSGECLDFLDIHVNLTCLEGTD